MFPLSYLQHVDAASGRNASGKKKTGSKRYRYSNIQGASHMFLVCWDPYKSSLFHGFWNYSNFPRCTLEVARFIQLDL